MGRKLQTKRREFLRLVSRTGGEGESGNRREEKVKVASESEHRPVVRVGASAGEAGGKKKMEGARTSIFLGGGDSIGKGGEKKVPENTWTKKKETSDGRLGCFPLGERGWECRTPSGEGKGGGKEEIDLHL